MEVRSRWIFAVLVVFALAAVPTSMSTAAEKRDRYIVVLENSVEHPANLARAQAEQDNGKVGFVYRNALNGYSVELPLQAAERLHQNPKVKYVAVDGEVVVPFEELIETIDHEEFEVLEPTVPTGIQRTFATANKDLDIDGVDDLRVDADVAVIDTGTSHTHADLNVVARTDCSNGTEKEAKCVDGSGTDANGHGTHVAGTIGAVDNGVGVVGMAPGARIWAVKVLGTGTNYMSEIIAGIDWITAKRKDGNPENDIEVANMSLGCSAFSPLCPPKPLDEAITKSVEAGVVHVVAAGNSSSDSKNFTPANSPDAITVSALADYEGKAEGKGSPTCINYGLDDRLASFSNFGSTVEIAAPGVCILSTVPSGYGLKSGTSMASPHVAGAAAILAARDAPKSKPDVEAITETLEKEGNLNWTDTSGDGIKEPLLDVSDESVFSFAGPPVATTDAPTNLKTKEATLNGSINPSGLATTYRFEYGKTTSYGSSVPIPNESVGSGNEAVAVSKTISGLSPETTYHYRVVAENSEGTTVGADRRFSTLAATPSQLGYTGSGKSGPGPGEFEYPQGVAVDQSGNVWVTDQPTNRVQKFNEKGQFVSQFGATGSGNGQLSSPYGIVATPSGDLWVVDAGNCRVQKFNNKGEYLAQFGSCGSANGQFSSPWGIAIAPDGSIWVSDLGNDRIQKFTSSGVYVTKVGSSGSGDGQFANPRGLGTDAEGNVWVADEGNHRVQKFSSAGTFLTKFGSKGSGDGEFDEPISVTVKPSGNLLVSDGYNNHRVQQVSPNGDFQVKFKGNMWTPVGVALGKGGKMFIVDRANRGFYRWLQATKPEATTDAPTNLKTKEATLNGSINPSGLATTYRFEYGKTTSYGTSVPIPNESVGSGNEAVAVSKTISGLSPETTYHYRVVAENSEGTTFGADRTFTALGVTPKSLYYFGGIGTGNGQFQAPEGIATDLNGNVWVSDRSLHRVQKFTEKGEYLLQFGSEGSGNGQFKQPRGIAATPSGDLWVVDAGNCRVQKFNKKGEYLAQFGSCGSANGQFSSVWGIAIAPDGSIWISDTGNDNVQKFTSSGAFILKTGSLGSGDGQFSNPMGIDTDSAGNLWITDSGNNRIQKLSSAGMFLAKFGSKGSGDGQFAEEGPVDVAVKPSGNLLVADGWANHRVQHLAPDGQQLAKIYEWSPEAVALGRGGKIFIPEGSGRVVYVWSQPTKPEATTDAPTNLKTKEATLNGSINPSGLATTYRFEYGKTTSYGSSVPIPNESVGSGNEAVAVSKTISGLSPETTYHYRVVAENSEGTTVGADRTFTPGTASALSSLAITESFDGSPSSITSFANNWTALAWAGGGTPKGEVTASGWRPVAAHPTINGAYYGSTLSDAGSGSAAVVTMAINPGSTSRNFALWLDLNIEGEGREGYALRFTYVSVGTYNVSLEKWQEGSQTILASKSSYGFVNGNSLAIVDSGGSVSAWTDTGSGFTQLLSAGDSAFESGNPAIEGAGNATRLKNFKAGEL